MHYTVSTVIGKPIAEVFAFVTNVENQARWPSATLENAQTTPGPMAAGTLMRHVGKWLGRRYETVARVTEYTPDRQWSYTTVSGPFRVAFQYMLIASGLFALGAFPCWLAAWFVLAGILSLLRV